MKLVRIKETGAEILKASDIDKNIQRVIKSDNHQIKSKMKTYVIILSKTFPKGHSMAGKETYFKEQVLNALKDYDGHTIERHNDDPLFVNGRKIHTIRENYTLWKKRIGEVNRGEACISLREWSGKPYHSQQREIAVLTVDNDMAVEKLVFTFEDANFPKVDGASAQPTVMKIARNDGLTPREWVEWFGKCDLCEPLAIIHFTNFRY